MSSERVTLAKAINTLTTRMDGFTKAVEKLSDFQRESLQEFDVQLTDKRTALEELDHQLEQNKNHHRIAVEQYLSECKYKGALKYLNEVNEVAINSNELEELRARVKELSEDQSERLKEAIAHQKTKSERGCKVQMNNLELKHKAEVAKMEAENEQYQREINNLLQSITNLKSEIAEQRKLTQQVAEASRPLPQMSMGHQSFSK